MAKRYPIYTVQLYEMYENMSSFISFELESGLDILKLKENLSQAIRLIKQKHPYLRMKIVQNENGDFEFEEQTADKELNKVYLECFEMSSLEELKNDWQMRFMLFGSKKETLTNQLYSLNCIRFPTLIINSSCLLIMLVKKDFQF